MEAIRLIKFGAYDHMLDLMSHGAIYLNTVDYFRLIEDGSLRQDGFEGTSHILRNQRMELFHKDKRLGGAENTSLFLRHKKDNGNLYCFTAIESRFEDSIIENTYEIDYRLKDFGDSFVIILHPREFVNRIKEGFANAGLQYKLHAVRYEDITEVHGEWGIFNKPSEYEYQMEWRLFVEGDGDVPLVVQIGSIDDIASIHHIDDLISTTN